MVFHRFRGSTSVRVLALGAFALMHAGNAQVMEGELHLTIRDSSGSALPARVELTGRSPEFRAESVADASGRVRLSRLAIGTYQLVVTHPGLQELNEAVHIRSTVPVEKLRDREWLEDRVVEQLSQAHRTRALVVETVPAGVPA